MRSTSRRAGEASAAGLGKLLLDRDGAGDRIDDRAELDQHAVAHRFDDAAAVARDERLDDLDAERLDGRDRRRLVCLDQARIADDVGHHDGRQPPLDSRV